MLQNMNIYIFFLLVLLTIHSVYCNRLGNNIYSSIEGSSACFKRLNGTHETGCSTSASGSVGVVQMIKDISDAQWMILNGTAGPYMAVVRTELFPDVMELFMENSHNVAGILVYENSTARDYSFSPESKCPNEYSSAPESTCSSSNSAGVWNEKGTNILRRNIPFPIFFVPLAQIKEIEDKVETCFKRFNLDRDNQLGRPLCSLQMNSFQFATISTEVCMRRSTATALISSPKVCDPLGDYNVLFSLYPRHKDYNDTVTLVTARIDTASLFDGVAPGAAGSVVGITSLLSTAILLSKMLPISGTQYNHNVLFTLFNGESFDYIGSQRVAYDISRGQWPPKAPLTTSQIKLHLDVGQMGGSFVNTKDQASWPIYGYVPYLSGSVPNEVTEFLAEMTSNLNSNNMTLSPEFSLNLPPSSLHSFRRVLKETVTGELPEVLLVDHQQTFTNHFYHSALDDDKNLGVVYRNITIGPYGTFVDTATILANGNMTESDPQVKIARFSTALAHTLYQRVTGAPYSGQLTASAHLVDEILYCFLKNQACQLLLAADYHNNPDLPPEKPAPLYISVASWVGSGAAYTGHILALMAGQQLDINRTACGEMDKPGYSYHYLHGWNHSGVCVETTLNFTHAISPAFTIPNYNYASGNFSTWTESVWQSMWVRLFVTASGAGATAAGICGTVSTLLAAAATYWLRRHSAVVFVVNSVPVDSTTGILRTVNC